MPKLTAHPSREELSAYSLGQLPEERAVSIDTHISQCEPCCETIVELSSEDTFAGLLQEAGRLPTDLTLDSDSSTAKSSSTSEDIPAPLAEHPRYEIVRLIGKGGMGDVYEARHRMMERTVALKVIKQELMRKPEAVDRFHREVKAAAQLAHPNVVTAYDAEQAGDIHFMVMEFVDGVDLSQMVKDRGALPVADACAYICQAAIGLQHAHERGMVHRDIKPHNLMVTADGTVKILDFGLASLAPKAIADADTVEARGDLTAAGAIMGTPDFISPEQADDARKADIRSDIYSLGATLYFLLAGRPPFAEGSVTQKLKSHAQAEPKPLKSLRDDVPPELVAIVTKMTAKDPERRFQTPVEVAEALKSFSQSAPREIVELPTQAKPRRWKPTFLSLTAVAAMFVAATVAGLIYYVQTNHGVVRVEVTDPSLEVSIKDHTITMKDGDEKPLTIRPGEQSLIVRNDDADFEFETDRFRIRRGDKIAFKVEYVKGEVVVRKDGERFHSKALPDDVKVEQILDRMVKAYAECESYRDSGVIKTVIVENADSPQITFEHSLTTVFERPDRFRFEIKDQDDDKLLISLDGQDIQTSWDIEPGFQKPESLELAMAQAVGFTGGDVGRIPAMLMPKKLDGWVDLDLIDPRQIEDGKLQNVECFRLEYNFRDEQIILWIDKQSHLVRRIDERIESDGIRISERTTTYDPTIDGKITEKMLEFDPPARRAADDSANTLPEEDLEQLQGDWETASVTEGGKTRSAEDGFGGLLLQIKGKTFVIGERKPNGEKSEVNTGRIEINSTTSPKTIDFIGRAQSAFGIYEFEDGVLRICLAEQGGTDTPAGARIPDTKPLKRPTTFDSPASSNIMLMEFSENQPAKQNDIPNIQGTWQVTYSEDGGRIAPQEMLKEIRFVIDEQNLTTEIGGRKSVSTYKLDPSTNPKSIDLTENGRTKQAIYDLVGDTLRICIAESGEQRPTAFDSQPNSANDIVLILKRVKPDNASADGTEDQKHNGPLSEELARSLIPMAASISNEDFQKLQTNPAAQTIKNKSLSLVLMTLDIRDQSPAAANDFRFLVEGYPKPSEIAAAMSPSRSKGYFSIIQPGYITECKITNSTDEIAQGKVTFNGPKLYIGSAIFEARKHEGTWRIEKFHLPSRQISIELGEDGNWHPEGKKAEGNHAPDPSDLIPDETPESSISNAADIGSLPLVEIFDATYINKDTVGLLVAHPQRILTRKSKVKEGFDQMFAKVAESEGLDIRNLRQVVAQLGPPPLSSRPIRNFFDEQIWTLILRFDDPVDVTSYTDNHASGYTKAEHKGETYYQHDGRMEMWFPDDRTLVCAAERRILSLIDEPEGKGPMAARMGRADAVDALLLEFDVRRAGPLLLESLPAEAQDPEVYPVIEQASEQLRRITLTAKQTSDTPILARFQAIDAETARALHDQASVLLETAKRGWPKLRESIRERPDDKNTKLASAFADEVDSLLPAIRLTVDEDQLLVRVEKEGGVDLADLLVFFMLID